jgi:hypothetical protein
MTQANDENEEQDLEGATDDLLPLLNEIDLSSLYSEKDMAELSKLMKDSEVDLSLFSVEQASELLGQLDIAESIELTAAEMTELLEQVKFSESEMLVAAVEVESPMVVNPNAMPSEVVAWMKSEVDIRGVLYQNWAALMLNRLFGEQFIYRNRNKNLAISQEILIEFLRLTKDYVVWNKRKRFWRIRREDDPETRSVSS